MSGSGYAAFDPRASDHSADQGPPYNPTAPGYQNYADQGPSSSAYNPTPGYQNYGIMSYNQAPQNQVQPAAHEAAPNQASPSYAQPGQPGPLTPSTSLGPGVSSRTEDYSVPGKLGPVDIETAYRANPSNGMYFGPYLRYKNVDVQNGVWLGSVMIVINSADAPYFQIHPTNDISQIQAVAGREIYQYREYRFIRYDLVLNQTPDRTGQFWTYAITHQGNTLMYKFLVAGAQETEWRFIAFSCADFSLGVKEEERRELGGVGYLWEDVLAKHENLGGLHVMLGGGDQIYADRMWKEIPSLQDWLGTKGKLNRRDYEWTPRLESDINLAYFFYYSNHFDRVGVRDCLAVIPNVFQIDDHDIFDGFGSYPDYMQKSHVVSNIGRIAFEFYLLFQHQTTEAILKSEPDPWDLFTVTGRGWHFLKNLGSTCVVLGPDTRAERELRCIIGEPTHKELFRRLEALPPSVRHIVIMLAVPIVYPRLTAVEHILSGVKHTKRAINGAWNLIGKATTKVASVVGAEDATKGGFENVKKAFGKSGVMGSVVSGFGEVDLLDDLADHWTHEHHAEERIFFVRNLQKIARDKSARVTFVSGDVHCCGMGKFYNPDEPDNYQLMYQVITSAISNVPPPGPVIRLLHNKDKIYLPEIGSSHSHSDTREAMIEFFERDVDGSKLDLKKLLPRRNYSIGAILSDGSMSWDLYVQQTGTHGTMDRTHKYGPLIVPPLASLPHGSRGGPDGSGYDEQYRSQQMSVAPGGVYGPGGLAEGVSKMNVN